MTQGPRTLGDLGEWRIISQVLGSRYGDIESFGDDCALLDPPPGHGLVATTDPCPEPMAAILGHHDLYYRGWLLATINLSDLAAAGATPLGLLTSLMLPRDLTLDDFERLLDGIDAACAASGTRVVGGNLKEAPRVDLTAMAIGSVKGRPLSRRGCRPGDHVVVIGNLGTFWAGALDAMRGLGVAADLGVDLLRDVLTPRAKTAAAKALYAASVVTCCMDNSDGLGSTLRVIAEKNAVGLELSLCDDALAPAVREVGSRLEVNPMRLVFGWGDWQLVICVTPDGLDAARTAADAAGESLHVLGRVVEGPAVVRATYLERVGVLDAPDSERFSEDSWFTQGIDGYIDRLLRGTFLR